MGEGWSKTLSHPIQGAAPRRAGSYMGSLVLPCYKSQDSSSFPVFFLFAVHTIGQMRSDLLGDQDITRRVNEEPRDGEIQLSWGPLMSNVRGKHAAALSWLCVNLFRRDPQRRGILSRHRMTTLTFSLSLFPAPLAPR